MAETLTGMARPVPAEAWDEGDSYYKSLDFYSAVATDVHPVYRFVGQSANAVAANAAREYAKVTAAGGVVIGVSVPHIHDDGKKEYYESVAVGEQAPICHMSSLPVLVEAGAGIVHGQVKPMTPIASDATGKAIPAAATNNVAGHAVGTHLVSGVTYVRVILAARGMVA